MVSLGPFQPGCSPELSRGNPYPQMLMPLLPLSQLTWGFFKVNNDWHLKIRIAINT